MNRRVRDLRLLLVLLVALAQAASAQTAAPSSSSHASAASARVEAVPFESKLVGKSLPYNVVLPFDYAQTAREKTRYPVLYLLHGLGGGAGDWVSQRARLSEHAAEHRIIIVVPEGKDGWYTDSATVAADKFETYFVEELMPDVQRRFRTVEAREGRAVAGLSMGGYGALKFGLKHPEKFALAASMSGALAAPSWKPEDPLPEFVKPSVVRVFGPGDSETRKANDIFRLAREMTAGRVASLPFLYLDCGTEDFLIRSNQEMGALLLDKKIPHEYRQLPGGHSWPYWDRQVREILKLAARKLAAPVSSAN